MTIELLGLHGDNVRWLIGGRTLLQSNQWQVVVDTEDVVRLIDPLEKFVRDRVENMGVRNHKEDQRACYVFIGDVRFEARIDDLPELIGAFQHGKGLL